ncbi:MAG: hypothetical protein O3A46_12365 [Candidatus Poribacteria bacterium]|nr:hypothetical protein [Candidatus Poribacteria bacterium]
MTVRLSTKPAVLKVHRKAPAAPTKTEAPRFEERARIAPITEPDMERQDRMRTLSRAANRRRAVLEPQTLMRAIKADPTAAMIAASHGLTPSSLNVLSGSRVVEAFGEIYRIRV